MHIGASNGNKAPNRDCFFFCSLSCCNDNVENFATAVIFSSIGKPPKNKKCAAEAAHEKRNSCLRHTSLVIRKGKAKIGECVFTER